MYQPTRIPQLDEKPELLKNVRFGIKRRSAYVESDDTTIEQLHIHSYTEMFFNVSSDVSFLVNNNLYPVRYGDAIVSRANDIHMCIYNRTRIHEYFCLWIDCPDDSPLNSFCSEEPHIPLFSFDKPTADKLCEKLGELADACENNAGELEKTALLFEVLVLLGKRTQRTDLPTRIPESFQRILDYINENYASIRCINDILEHFFISAATLNRLFRRYIHLSARKYLESKKLANAAELLSEGESVTNACMLSGFSDCSHFIRLFKKTFGETPLKYKQHLR